jgi:hypothetical protein
MFLARTIPLAFVTTLSLLAATTAHAQPAAPATAATPATEVIDHDKVVGGIGATYFGQFNVPYGNLGTTAATQIVGVRYWVSPRFAIDGGFGILSSSGSTKSGSTTNDTPSLFGFSLKAGVPIALLGAAHYTFFIEPQFLFGTASKSTRPPGADETKDTGTHIALGATAGAEIQFGFIGIPHLALDATIGLGLDLTSGSTKTGANPETSQSATNFGTAAFASPWNIFTTNVAARYYF